MPDRHQKLLNIESHKNLHGKYFICIVNVDKRRDFYQYLKKDKQKIILWLKKSNLDLLEKINK